MSKIDPQTTKSSEWVTNPGVSMATDARIQQTKPAPAPLPKAFKDENSYDADLTQNQLATFNQNDLKKYPLPKQPESGYDANTIVLTEGHQNSPTALTEQPKTAPSVMLSVAESKSTYAETLNNIKTGKLFERNYPHKIIEAIDNSNKANLKDKDARESHEIIRKMKTSLPRGIDNSKAADEVDKKRQNSNNSNYLLISGPDGRLRERITNYAATGAVVAGTLVLAGLSLKRGGPASLKLIKNLPPSIKDAKNWRLGLNTGKQVYANRHALFTSAKNTARTTAIASGATGLAAGAFGGYQALTTSTSKRNLDYLTQQLQQQGVPKENITHLFNPTNTELNQAVDAVAKKANANPQAVTQVVVNAHGNTAENLLGLPHPKAKTAGDQHYVGLIGNKRFNDDWITEDDLKSIDKKIKGPLGILMDSCYSGAAVAVDKSP